MFTFGYMPGIAGTPYALGARTIDDGDSMDFVPGRTTWYIDGQAVDMADPSPEQRAAVFALNPFLHRLIDMRVQPAFREAKARGELRGDTAGEVVLYADWFVRCVANTNGSHGYVYLALAIKALPDLPVVLEKCDDEALVWSNEDKPDVGDRVWSKSYGCQATVLGYAVDPFAGPYLFMIVDPDTWPDWVKPEARLFTNLMGREWRDIDTETPIRREA